MLYIFYGTNIDASREKMNALIDTLRAETPDAPYERMTADQFDLDVIRSRAEEIALFSPRTITVLDGVLEGKDAAESFVKIAGDLARSENIFALFAEKIGKDLLDACKSAGAEIVLSDTKNRSKEWSGGTTFALADAYVKGDKKNAWVFLQNAKAEGARDEEIAGALFWRVKTMLLAVTCRSAEEAGLKPFVFQTAKRLSAGKTEREIKKMLGDIVSLIHNTRRNSEHLDVAIEKLLLNTGTKKGGVLDFASTHFTRG